MEKFYDLLFEISSDYRHEILLKLLERPMRVTDISKEMNLTSQEISRHVSRLGESDLTLKDVEGFHHLSNYGLLVLALLDELQFASLNRKYFTEHTLKGIPNEFIKRIGDLKGSRYTNDVINFIQCIERLIQDSKQFVFFIANQFPLSSISFLNEALDRGVRFKSIDKVNESSGSWIIDEKAETQIDRVRGTPLIEHRTLESSPVLLFISEKDLIVSFPTTSSEFDYKGFISSDKRAVSWGIGLFEYFWERAESSYKFLEESPEVKLEDVTLKTENKGVIIVEGHDDHRIDPFAVQDAVDNYSEVILRGIFNFEKSTVTIRKNVKIRGEGRENDIPSTVVCRRRWSFPSAEVNQLFLIDGEDVDVTIENIHFTDFFAYCILGIKGNKVNIINNRITLESGFYRGITNIAFGDGLIGFIIIDDFPGGVNIEGNNINLATDHMYGGFIFLESMKGPDGKPDCINHKYFSSYGVYVRDVSGNIKVINNVFKNMTARAISVCGSSESTEVEVSNNKIISDVYGSYVIDNRWAGIGIAAHCSWRNPTPGFKLKIENNLIQFSKPDFCGIALIGPYLSPKGTGKLAYGTLRNNRIKLNDGAIGILMESCDGFTIKSNKIKGNMYYGIGLFPRFDEKRTTMGAFDNHILENDLTELEIKSNIDYTKTLFHQDYYTETRAIEETAHIWLNKNTGNNLIIASSTISIVDEGKDNKIEITE